jgi:hypothetical protein
MEVRNKKAKYTKRIEGHALRSEFFAENTFGLFLEGTEYGILIQ